MATPKKVTGKMLNPSDAGLKGAIIATLSQVAYVNGGEVVSPTVDGVVLSDGTWSFDPTAGNGLYSNSDLTPTNTHYAFAESVGWHQVTQDGVVPAGEGPFVFARDVLISSAPLPSTAIPESQVTNLVGDLSTLTASVAELEADIGGLEGSPVLSVAGRGGAVALAVGDVSGAAPTARQVIAGSGLTGGGDLTADRTLSIPTGGVTSAMILNGAIVDADINASAAIAASKLAAIPTSGITGLDTALGLKAPLANPIFTGGATVAPGAVLTLGPQDGSYLGVAVQTRSVWADRSARWSEVFQYTQTNKPGPVAFTDSVWGWGYNMTPNFVKVIGTEPMVSDRIESAWYSPSESITTTERHIAAYIDPANGGSEIRPYSIIITQGADGGLGSPQHRFTIGNANDFEVADNAGNQYVKVGNGYGAIFGRGVLLTGAAGVAGSASLQLGTPATSTGALVGLTLNPATTDSAAVVWNQASAGTWEWYQLPADANMYFRQLGANAYMVLTAIPGTGGLAGTGVLAVGAKLTVAGGATVGGALSVASGAALAAASAVTVNPASLTTGFLQDWQVGGASKAHIDSGGIGTFARLVLGDLISAPGTLYVRAVQGIVLDASVLGTGTALRINPASGTGFLQEWWLGGVPKANLDANGKATFNGGLASTLPAFVAADKYVTIDSSGNLHASAIGPAS